MIPFLEASSEQLVLETRRLFVPTRAEDRLMI